MLSEITESRHCEQAKGECGHLGLFEFRGCYAPRPQRDIGGRTRRFSPLEPPSLKVCHCEGRRSCPVAISVCLNFEVLRTSTRGRVYTSPPWNPHYSRSVSLRASHRRAWQSGELNFEALRTSNQAEITTFRPPRNARDDSRYVIAKDGGAVLWQSHSE